MRRKKESSKGGNAREERMGEFDRIIEFAIRTDVELYTAMPTGWRKITGSMTAPRGSTWIYNGKSYFSGQRKTALLVEKECLK